jgi:hypothetical protein
MYENNLQKVVIFITFPAAWHTGESLKERSLTKVQSSRCPV